MFKNLAAALVATTLVAGTAFAAQPSTDNTATPATTPAVTNNQSAPAAVNGQTATKQANAVSSTAAVKHTSKPASHHTAHAAKPAATPNTKSPT
jgi:hypothetical protein